MAKSIPTFSTDHDSIWVDDTGTFYTRFDSLDSVTNTIVSKWYNATTGQRSCPGVGLKPVSAANSYIVQQYYHDIINSNAYGEYSAGDIVIHIMIYNIVTYSVTNVWLNFTRGATMSPQYYPLAGDIVPQNRNGGISYIGNAPFSLGPRMAKDSISVTPASDARALVGSPTYSILSTTTETEIIPVGAVAYNDIRSLTISNTSAAPVSVDFRDSLAGAVRFSARIPANDTRQFAFDSAVLKQVVASSAWTAQLSAATTDVRITAIYNATN